MLNKEDLARVRDFLLGIKPMPAVFDPRFVTRINGTNVKQGKTKRDLAEQLRQDIRDFKARHGLERLVMVWCASTEIFIQAGAVHASLKSFEKAMDENHVDIAPSMLYAWAALMEGVPFANGAPNLAVDIRAIQELARERELPISGKDFKTGQTLMKTDSANDSTF